MRITRRTFLLFFIGSVAAVILWILRRFDLSRSLQEFFAFDPDVHPEIAKFVEATRTGRPLMYLASTIFFTLSQLRAEIVVPKNFRVQILRYWGNHFLGKPSIVRPYMHYPEANDLMICSGLIRP